MSVFYSGLCLLVVSMFDPLRVHVYVHVCVRLCVRMCVNVYVRLCVRVGVCLIVRLYAGAHVRFCTHDRSVLMSVWVSVSVSVYCPCWCLRLCLCPYVIHACVRMFVLMCLYACANLNITEHLPHPSRLLRYI